MYLHLCSLASCSFSRSRRRPRGPSSRARIQHLHRCRCSCRPPPPFHLHRGQSHCHPALPVRPNDGIWNPPPVLLLVLLAFHRRRRRPCGRWTKPSIEGGGVKAVPRRTPKHARVGQQPEDFVGGDGEGEVRGRRSRWQVLAVIFLEVIL